MEFRNTTSITRENYLKYLKIKIKIIIIKELLKWYVFNSCGLIIFHFILKDYKAALIEAPILTLDYFCFFIIAKSKRMPKRALKKYYPGDNLFTYDFNEKFFRITDNTKSNKLVTIKYTMLHRICETKNFFYLFYNKYDAYIVDKAGFENHGDVGKLRQILKGSGFLGKYYDLIHNYILIKRPLWN